MDKNFSHGDIWSTEEEDALIQAKKSGMTLPEIFKKKIVNRSLESIKHKWKRVQAWGGRIATDKIKSKFEKEKNSNKTPEIKYKKSGTETVVIAGDFHIPQHNEVAVDALIKYLKKVQPDIFVINGDFLDAYQVSKFDKEIDRIGELQEDIDMAVGILRKIRKVIPNADIFYISGNHEERIKKFLLRSAAQLSPLRALKIESLLELDKLRIIYKEFLYYRNTIFIKHGDIARATSGATVQGELTKMNVSGVSSHIHSAAQIYRKNGLESEKMWMSTGCLCELDGLGYCDYPSWSHGIAEIIWDIDSKTYVARLKPIIKGEVK